MEYMTDDEIKKLIRTELAFLIKNDKYVFDKYIQLMDGRDIQLGRTTGTRIGTAGDQKLSVYGVAPVAQAGAIAAPSGGATVDSEARTCLALIRTALRNFGITL